MERESNTDSDYNNTHTHIIYIYIHVFIALSGNEVFPKNRAVRVKIHDDAPIHHPILRYPRALGATPATLSHLEWVN